MGKRHPEETIELGLTVLALSGDDTEKASKMLAGQGTHLSGSTLRRWRHQHTERYTEIRDTRARQIEGTIIAQARDIAIAAGDLEQDLMAEVRRKLKAGELKDPAGSLRNVSTTKGINVDKSLVLDGRPDSIVGHIRSRDDIFAELERDGLINNTVEGTAEPLLELADGTVVPLPPTSENPTEGRSSVGGNENAPGQAA